MDCMVVARTSAGNICMHEAGRISVAYVCDMSLRSISCAGLRNVSRWFVRACIL